MRPTLCAQLATAAIAMATAAWGQSPAPATTPRPLAAQQTVTVTADRGLADTADPTGSTTALDAADLLHIPALSLDERLRQSAGFLLFRRTSSWTANPTTEGVSLRGLGSTAASRTLVVSDQVPLNDPFGGWIHWEEIPALAIDGVVLLRGGAADLYGSAAIGGVIDVLPRKADPTDAFHAQASLWAASESTASGDGFLSGKLWKQATGLAALTALSTGGYIPTAPSSRGAIDTTANVVSQAARTELRQAFNARTTAFLRGNLLNESRGNATPLQTNGTRLWRYAAGADRAAEHLTEALRMYGSRETYRQTFSAIAADRNSESLTKLQAVPTDETGAVAQATWTPKQRSAAGVGLDLRDVRATDNETAVSKNIIGATTSTSAHQREIGGYAVAQISPTRPATLTASIRVDSFRTFDAQTTTSATTARATLPQVNELAASPHAGASLNITHGFLLRANAFRAFRGPTMNELYRTGQVGSQTTLANPSLLAERATGFEAGTTLTQNFGSIDASYFWTEVNRPVSAVLLTQTATTQTLQRQNLGQIRSRGLSLQARTSTFHGFDVTASYQLAFATVTAYNSGSPAQANLTGNQIPQVPRHAAAATLNWAPGPKALRGLSMHALANYTGAQFDDAANQFVLHPYARLDVSAERNLGPHFQLFIAAQNILNRAIEAGRTPVLTLAAPRLVIGGLRWHF